MPEIGTNLRESAVVVFEDFIYNPAGQRLMYLGKDRPAEPKVLRMLELLLDRHGQPIAYEELGADLWPDTHVEVRANLNTLALKLRRALSPHGHRYILTSHGEGYRFNPQVPIARSPVAATFQEELAPAPRQQNWRRSAIILGVVCVLAALGGWYGLRKRPGSPADFRIEGNQLIVTDRNENEVFRRSFGTNLEPSAYSASNTYRPLKPWFGDLSGSGGPHVLFPVRPAAKSAPVYAATIEYFGFNADGPPEWRFLPSGKVMFSVDGARFDDHYSIAQFLVLKDKYADGRKVVVSSNHFISYPDQIAVFDAKGRILSEYWNAGHLLTMTTADLAGDGREKLLLGGVNDGYEQAVMLEFDPARIEGQSDVPAGDRHGFKGLGKGSEIATVFFPRSCLLRYNRVRTVQVIDKTIYVIVTEGLDEIGPEVTYQLDFQFNVQGLTVSNPYHEAHREMEDAGKLHHKVDESEIKALRQIRIVRNNIS